jgi:hypothetical protein
MFDDDFEDNNWNFGPDTLYSAKSYTATKLNQAVKIRLIRENQTISKTYSENRITSIFTRFKSTVEKGPKQIALGIIWEN